MEAYEEALFAELASQAGMEGRWNAAAADKAGVKDRPQALTRGVRRAGVPLAQDQGRPGRANWTRPSACRAGPTSGRSRSSTAWTCWPPACARRSASWSTARTRKTIQEVCNQVADVVRDIPGAVDVVADQTVGKGYVEVEIDRERAARYGVNVGDIQDVIEVALGGKPDHHHRRRAASASRCALRYARDYRVDEESIRKILVSPAAAAAWAAAGGGMGGGWAARRSRATAVAAADAPVYLGDVANVRVVEGPVMIKSENGLLRSYVQLNVRDRDIVGFVEEAQRVVAAKVKLPEGSFLEWSGQFEHQVRARKTLSIVFPAVLLLIFVILYLTYNDFAHAAADDAGRARRAGRRRHLPDALRLQLQRGGVGGLHRLLRHGHGDGHHHARVPARRHRRTRRAGEDRQPGGTRSRHHGRRGAPPAARSC